VKTTTRFWCGYLCARRCDPLSVAFDPLDFARHGILTPIATLLVGTFPRRWGIISAAVSFEHTDGIQA
jgi:hypothetical protein